MVALHGVPGALPTGVGFGVVVVGLGFVVVGGGGGGVVVVVVGATVVVVVVVVVVPAAADVLAGDASDARFTPVEHAVSSDAAPTASASTILFTRTEFSPAQRPVQADHLQRRDTVCGGCRGSSVSS
jgi:hypothetical protein